MTGALAVHPSRVFVFRTMAAVVLSVLFLAIHQGATAQPTDSLVELLPGIWKDQYGKTWTISATEGPSADVRTKPAYIARLNTHFSGRPVAVGGRQTGPLIGQTSPVMMSMEQAAALVTSGDPKALRIDVEQPEGNSYTYDEILVVDDLIVASRVVSQIEEISSYDLFNANNGLGAFTDVLPYTEFAVLRYSADYDTLHGEASYSFFSGFIGTDLRRSKEATIHFVAATGAPLDLLTGQTPFRLEARLPGTQPAESVAMLDIDGTEVEIDLSPAVDPATGDLDFNRLTSGILYLTSQQFLGRREGTGLFRDSRFVPERALDGTVIEWQGDTARAEAATAAEFAGQWLIAHSGDPARTGLAEVSQDGRNARLALEGPDGLELYQSFEIRTLADGAADGNFSLRMARVHHPVDPSASAGLRPLPQGRVLHAPTLLDRVTARLDGASAIIDLDLAPAPDDVIRIDLRHRSSSTLGGSWHVEVPAGGSGDGGRASWSRGFQIDEVLVLENQTEHRETSRFHYPWGPRAAAGSSDRRSLVLIGRDLPDISTEDLVIESLSDGITYPFQENASDLSAFARSWVGPDPPELAPGQTAILLQANFGRDVEPGFKRFTVNGQPVDWHLTFADAIGRLYFVDTPPATGIPTDTLYSSDTGQLELLLEAPFPLVQPVEATLSRKGETIATLVLKRLDDEDSGPDRSGMVYRSQPISFFRSDFPAWEPPAEDGALRIDLAQPTGAENEFTFFDAAWSDEARLSVPLDARVQVRDSPADEGRTLWRDALIRAAACYDDVVISPGSAADEVSSVILTEVFADAVLQNPPPSSGSPAIYRDRLRQRGGSQGNSGIRNVPYTLGDHAAAILLREGFVLDAGRRLADYLYALESTDVRDKFIRTGQQTDGASDPFWSVMEFEVAGIQYQALDLLRPNGLNRIAYDQNLATLMALGIDEPSELALGLRPETKAERGRFTDIAARVRPETARSVRDGLVRHLLKQYTDHIRNSIFYADNASDCDDGALFAIAGFPLPSVVDGLMPRLVRLQDEGRHARSWMPDNVARGYVRGLYVKGAAIRALDAYADADKAVAAAALSLTGAGAGFTLAQGFGRLGAAALAGLTADVIDGVVFGGLGILNWWKDRETIAIARGASASAGALIYEEAVSGRQSGIWAVMGVLFPAVSGLSNLSQLRAAGRFNAGRDIARGLHDFDSGTLARLSDQEHADVLRYVEEISQARTLARTRGVLDRAFNVLTTDGRRLSADDLAVLYAMDARALRQAEAVQHGAEVGAKLDAIDTRNLARLDPDEYLDLQSHAADIRRRQAALASGEFHGRVQLVSAREAALADGLADIDPTELRAARRTFADTAAEASGAGADATRAEGSALPSAAPPERVATSATLQAPRPATSGETAPTAPLPDAGPSARPRVAASAAETLSDPSRPMSSAPTVATGRPRQPGQPPEVFDDGRPASSPTAGTRPSIRPDRAPAVLPAAPALPVRTEILPSLDFGPPPSDFPGFLTGVSGTEPRRLTILNAPGDVAGEITIIGRPSSGSFNRVFDMVGNNDQIARFSALPANSTDNLLDQSGWQALESLQGGGIYVPGRTGPFLVSSDELGIPRLPGEPVTYYRVEFVERIGERAREQLLTNPGGLPTPGQAIALDRAKRTLNAAGYAWLDNHIGNFGFRPVAGADQWEIAIFDPGGIVRVRDGAGFDAFDVQRALDNPSVAGDPRLTRSRIRREVVNRELRGDILDRFGPGFELPEGLAGPDQIGFRADSFLYFPRARLLSRFDDGPLLEAAYANLATTPLTPPPVASPLSVNAPAFAEP